MPRRGQPNPKQYAGKVSFIAQKRLEKGLTQTEIAKRLGVSRVCFTRFENNTRCMSVDLLLPLSEILECDVRDLLMSIM